MHGLIDPKVSNGAALIVDDDDHMRSLLASMVRDLGFTRVVEAASINGALNSLSSNAISIVLVDLCLVSEDGLALVAAIREHPAQSVRDLPIVVVSRAATEARVRSASNAGVDGFIAKPLSTATFRRQVSLAFVKRSLITPQAPRRQDVLATLPGDASVDIVELG